MPSIADTPSLFDTPFNPPNTTVAPSTEAGKAGYGMTIAATSDPAAFENYVPNSLPEYDTRPVINPNTGTFSKATDTLLDLAGIFGKAYIGTRYPTGQQNPAAVAAQPGNAAGNGAGIAATSPNWMPYAVVAGLAAVALILLTRRD